MDNDWIYGHRCEIIYIIMNDGEGNIIRQLLYKLNIYFS